MTSKILAKLNHAIEELVHIASVDMQPNSWNDHQEKWDKGTEAD